MALRDAIREYEANKWKAIGQKLGKPAKVGGVHDFYSGCRTNLGQACEQYAKENFKSI